MLDIGRRSRISVIGVNREEVNGGADCWQCAPTLVRQHAALKFKLFFREENFIDQASEAVLLLISDVAP